MKKLLYLGLLLAFFPFLALGLYNHPSVDDYDFTTRASHGFWQAQAFWYLKWEGRYFTTMLLSLDPLGIKSLFLYRLMPLVLAVGLVHALYLLLKEFSAGIFSRQQVLTAALMFFLLYIANMPDVYQGFYWYTGAWTYQSADILILYLLTCVARLLRDDEPAKTKYTVFAACLALAVAGSNETVMIILVCLLAAMLFWSVCNRRMDGRLLGLLIAAGAGAAVVVAAPGNAIRIAEDFPTRYGMQYAAHAAIAATFKSLFYWVFSVPVAGVTVLAVAWGSRLAEYRIKNGRRMFVHPLFSLAVFLGLLMSGYLPAFWSMGGMPPGRTMDVIYLLFLLGWFFNVYIVTEYALRQGFVRQLTLPAYAPAVICVLIFLSFGREGQNIRIAYGELLSGKAAAYDRQVQARYQQLKECAADACQVDRFVDQPKTIFFDDITADPTDWRNLSYAEYYHKKQVVLKS